MYRNRIARPPTARRRILLVEDNPDGRESLRMLLSLLGHQVEVAADGIEGVQKALAFRPDVALIDIGLPRLDGYEVARRIREALGPTVVLLAYTAYDSEDAGWHIAAAGFNGHLVKPVELRELTPWLGEDAPCINDWCGTSGSRE